MKKLIYRILVLCLFGLTLAACTSSYVDPKYKNVSMSEIQSPAGKHRVRLSVAFQTNGKPNEYASKKIKERIKEVLEKTGVVEVVTDEDKAPAEELNIVMNNFGDMGDAMAKGFGTGLTFGLVGSMVTDGYSFEASYQPSAGGEAPVTKRYEHAIYTTVGNKQGPEGLTPLSVGEAFNTVLNDLIIVFLRDLQKDGYLSSIQLDHYTGQLAYFTRVTPRQL